METHGKSPLAAETVWATGKERRRGLTLAEAIALARHGQAAILSRHGVWATASRYEAQNQVPLVHLEEGKPSLDWGNAEYADDHIGSPSCGFR